MKRKHYILIAASVAMALLPVFSSELVPIAVVGAAEKLPTRQNEDDAASAAEFSF